MVSAGSKPMLSQIRRAEKLRIFRSRLENEPLEFQDSRQFICRAVLKRSIIKHLILDDHRENPPQNNFGAGTRSFNAQSTVSRFFTGQTWRSATTRLLQ